MSPREIDNPEWEETRARIDSLAGSVFLLSGGVLSVSIGLVLGNLERIGADTATGEFAVLAWWLLVYPIVAFLSLKANLVVQKYILLEHPDRHMSIRPITNGLGWFFATTGLVSFCAGMVFLVIAAQSIVQG